MSQVGCAPGCLRCRKASSKGQSLHVLATAAMSTSHLHTCRKYHETLAGCVQTRRALTV